ncbi:aldo/keto reductase [Devosia nitrariae]|uniref:Oxidoreductase n=1 Tax=Devosia nitrariae TaxID=2071872 RepID=A0ABQ5VYH9_9HYPH|nr:aldo/keto reductase [Devosia nitrariae]GLQ52850.1 oxidoreductase [Devosia nitrariae]
MALDQPWITLSDGNGIPQIGFGVWRLEERDAPAIVGEAIRVGYRHIDTAQGYDNEAGVGQAIREAEVPREELFVTSKLRTGDQGYDNARRSFEASLKRMGLDIMDLFLIHWPVPAQDKYAETWKAFIDLQKEGRVRSIGVSNFLPVHLDRIIGETGVAPAVNQIELHPYYQQRDVRDYHAGKGIVIESYSPLGSGAVIGDETIAEIGRKYGKSVGQTIIRWHLQQGLVVLPKTATPARISENFDVFDFTLSPDDMARIDALDQEDGKTLPQPERMNNVF